jgi:mono/diheme cytochrome c family protein
LNFKGLLAATAGMVRENLDARQGGMGMKRKRVMAGTYVLAAGLLLALGATAHYAGVGTREPAPARSTAQMGQGMMGQNMAAAREQMQTIVDKLMENHDAMTKAKSLSDMKPLLAVNHTLLERLRDEMNRSWGMHRHGMGGPMGPPHAAGQPRSAPRSAAPARSATEGKLVARGRHLFAVDSCRVCHGPTAQGTAMAPSLHGVGMKYSAEKIAHLIRHPLTPKMPSFSASAVSDADLKAIIAFLQTLK